MTDSNQAEPGNDMTTGATDPGCFRLHMSDGTEFGPADLDLIVQWAREGRVPRDALLYPADGGDPRSVFAVPRLAAILAAPPTAPTMAHAKPAQRSSVWMPTGNQPAIWGYYLGVASLLPFLIVLAPVSLILGAVGIVRAVTRPQARGLLHAITAIVLSIGSPLLWWAVFLYFVNNY